MNDRETLRKEVWAAVENAFGELRHAGRERLYDAELADNYGMESCLTEELKDLTYERWSEIPGTVIARCHSALSFFDPQSFQFHLPAYMTWTLDNYLTSDSLSADMTIYSLLLYTEDEEVAARQLERFRIFDKAQREAIISFLRFAELNDDYLDGHAARRALDNYWSSLGKAW